MSREGPDLLFAIAKEVEKMLQMKVEAVTDIVDKAEELAMNAWYYSDYSLLYPYRDAKRLNVTNPYFNETIELKENSHFFGQAVNTSYSAVQVPTNIYDGKPIIHHGIKWSVGLDEVFVENYRRDPSLYWQYFGSSVGFMRRYPASWWDPNPKGGADLFDCRTRAWFIEAATSPKDVLILVDNSGSMTGQKRNIARNVVFEILDSLGSNDYVNILSFNITVLEVVCCFKDKLVQANLANIRDFKMGMEALEKPRNISEFPGALNEAFRLLEQVRMDKGGSSCNQAIMLITDGAPENFKEIFERWNWGEFPRLPVRVFTYLIGAEADLREMQWMACANMGYFVHINDISDVRELVLRYISVMARPLVLNNTYHPVAWAPVYADIVDPKMTDYLWEMKEKEIQKGITWLFRHTKEFKKWKNGDYKDERKKDKKTTQVANMAIRDEDIKDDREYLMDTKIKRYPYKMMISVSMPVYDTMENSSIQAKILGVAGTDIPNFEIQRLMIPHMLGVNGYAFIVTNNGYLLIHPELRPEFEVSISGKSVSILKPNYNNIDFMDVELSFKNETEPSLEEKEPVIPGVRCSKDDNYPRKNKAKFACRKDDLGLLNLREELINQGNGSTSLLVITHYDGMRRVHFNKRHYYYTFIPGTPFEIVVALPDVYGLNRVEAKLDIKRTHARGKKASDFFKGRRWKIHPNWFYCKYHYSDHYNFDSPEEELLHFLNKYSQAGWKWPKQARGTPDHYHCHICNSFKDRSERTNFYCDKALFLSLVYDAKVTEWFSDNVSLPDQKSQQKFGLVLVFIATRSGLTRWLDISSPSNKTDYEYIHFSDIHKSAIDESFYKRAIEQYYIDPHSFVYSVPFNAGNNEGTLVTASHAIFSIDGSREAPVSVVGFQFLHSAFHTYFQNITYPLCAGEEYECYILDNSGYIIVSKNRNNTGKFFGEIEGATMERMVSDRVYRRAEVSDYQAVCFTKQAKKISDNKLYINRTRPIPCQTKVQLYTLNKIKLRHGIAGINCSRPYIAKDISYSNLILVVINSSCPINRNITLLAQPEEVSFDKFWCCKSDRNLTRRNLAECTNYNVKEENISSNLCGNASTFVLSVMVLTLNTMLPLMMIR